MKLEKFITPSDMRLNNAYNNNKEICEQRLIFEYNWDNLNLKFNKQ